MTIYTEYEAEAIEQASARTRNRAARCLDDCQSKSYPLMVTGSDGDPGNIWITYNEETITAYARANWISQFRLAGNLAIVFPGLKWNIRTVGSFHLADASRQ